MRRCLAGRQSRAQAEPGPGPGGCLGAVQPEGFKRRERGKGEDKGFCRSPKRTARRCWGCQVGLPIPRPCIRDSTQHLPLQGLLCPPAEQLDPPPPSPRGFAVLREPLCLLSYLIALLLTPGNEQKMVIAALSDDVNTRCRAPFAKPLPGRALIYGTPPTRPAPPAAAASLIPGCGSDINHLIKSPT